PPDLPMTGGFIDLVLQAEAQVDEILRDAAGEVANSSAPAGSTVQQIVDLYTSFLDEQAVEELGSTPLESLLAVVDSIDGPGELASVLGSLERIGVTGVFSAYVNTDDRQSDRYIVNIAQGGLGLPDEAYYRDDAFAETRKAYLAHVEAMLVLLGADEAVA